MTHDTTIETNFCEIDLRAACSCGWKGELRRSLAKAMGDANDHQAGVQRTERMPSPDAHLGANGVE